MAPDKGTLSQVAEPKITGGGEGEKISIATAYLMIGVALLFDAFGFIINFIPVVGQVITLFSDFIAYLSFFLWFTVKGVKLMTRKNLAVMGGGFIVSFIPILDALPELTAAVFITIMLTRIEDLVKKRETQLKSMLK